MNTTKSRLKYLTQLAAESSECICERRQTNLICIECRRRLFGRVHKVCEKHPTVRFFFFFWLFSFHLDD